MRYKLINANREITIFLFIIHIIKKKEIIHEGYKKKFEKIKKPYESPKDVIERTGFDEEEDLDVEFLARLDDLIPLRGNRAYALSQIILHPEGIPDEIMTVLKNNDVFVRQLLVNALNSDNTYHDLDIKTDSEIRKAKIESNNDLIKKLEEKISVPDSGGFT